MDTTHFKATLAEHNLELVRRPTETLQINLGYMCNQVCKHCHLEAGPNRTENMDAATVDEVVAYAARGRFKTVDITGGAPEMNPNLIGLIEKLTVVGPKIMLRSNLTALKERMDQLIEPMKDHKVSIITSFPSLNEFQTDSQRGRGVFDETIETILILNKEGYGNNGNGLELNLVSNPTGAFMPSNQEQAEKRFHEILEKKWGITFNNLFNFANVPLGRFRNWLINSGNFESYMQKLVSSFNPCSVEGLMCRTLVSVSWDGYMYDCDFNLARGLNMCGKKVHVSEMPGPPETGTPIATADHCYTCTAGSGFT